MMRACSVAGLAAAARLLCAAAAAANGGASQSGEATGAQLSISYTGEWWRANRGPGGGGSRYLDNLDLTVEIDAARLWGFTGLTLFGYVLYNNGRSVSALTADAQGVSNIEADRALRLYEFWAEWRFGAAERHSTRFGLYDLNSEFDSIPSAGLFVNPSQGIGPEFSQTGLNGPSIFPVTSVGARYRYDAPSGWTVLGAVLDGVPGDPQHPKRTVVRLSDRDGLLWVAEASLQRGAVTKIAAGAWGYSARFDDLLVVDANGSAVRRRGNRGLYAQADVALLGAPSADQAPRLSAFLRWGRANPDLNRFARYWGSGLVWRAVLGPGSGDELGVAIAHARNGGPWRALQRTAGEETAAAETVLELTWRLPVNDWLVLQPDLQWIRNPDTDPARRSVLAAALRFEVAIDRALTRAEARR
jgi:porin